MPDDLAIKMGLVGTSSAARIAGYTERSFRRLLKTKIMPIAYTVGRIKLFDPNEVYQISVKRRDQLSLSKMGGRKTIKNPVSPKGE